MAEHPDSTQRPRGSSALEEILAVIAEAEPHSVTADHVARAVDFGWDVVLVQDGLEELVEHGLLNRLGIGLAAVYTRNSAT